MPTKKNYVAYFSVNGTSGKRDGFTSLADGKKAARAMAMANCPKGGSGFWDVSLNGERVAQGTVHRSR